MFDTFRKSLIGERRREIAATRIRKQTEELVSRVDGALLELDANENAANERSLSSALDALKAHVLARLVESDGDIAALPLDSTLADGRMVREVCADEIAVVLDVRKCAEEAACAERCVVGTRARLDDVRKLHVVPLEVELAADVDALEAAKAGRAEAVRGLDALKRKYKIR